MSQPFATESGITLASKLDQSVTHTPSPLTPRPPLRPGNPLVIKEILKLILQFADQRSRAAASKVCQLWSGIALDELWRSLPSIFPLLKLLTHRKWVLTPTTYHKNLLSSLAKADWDRFKQYALRVRSVGAGHTGRADLPLDSAALVQMFGPSPLLPNLKTLSWRFIQSKNCMSIVPFIGPKLESLVLVMEEGIESLEQSLLMQSLSRRMPALKSLRLVSFSPAHHMTTSLAALISSSPKLTRIELPPFFLTQEIVAATAQLPLLAELSFSKWTKAAETYHESGMSFKFTPASFLGLDILSFASLPNRMAEVLQSTDHVGRLRTVFLDCPAYNSLREVENVFAALGSGAQNLDNVQLVCSPIPQLASSSSKDSLSVDTIRPLFSCTQLRRLYLSAPHMVPLQDEDVIEMGKCWPAMRNLILCPSPLVNRDRGQEYGILPTFAKNLPNLRELQLYFGAGAPKFGGDLYPVTQFKGLEALGVGFSVVPRKKAQEIGFLLASLCPFPPSIEYGVLRYHRGDDITEAQATELADGWGDVRAAVDLAFRIKGFQGLEETSESES